VIENKFIESFALIKLLETISSTDKEKNLLCRDLLEYFLFIKNGEHLWFASVALSIDKGIYPGFICVNKIMEKMQPKSEAKKFIELINRKYLFPAKKEITTTHGIRKTFRFLEQAEKQELVAQTRDFMESMRAVSENVCFGYGAVLGAVRDGHLIDHDDDFDIVMGFPVEMVGSREEAQNIIVDFLRNNLQIHAVPYSNSHVQVFKNEWGLDIFIGMISDGAVYFRPVPEEGIPTTDIFPAKTIELEGIKCPAPANPEKYLEWRYGDGWKTPDKYYSIY